MAPPVTDQADAVPVPTERLTPFEFALAGVEAPGVADHGPSQVVNLLRSLVDDVDAVPIVDPKLQRFVTVRDRGSSGGETASAAGGFVDISPTPPMPGPGLVLKVDPDPDPDPPVESPPMPGSELALAASVESALEQPQAHPELPGDDFRLVPEWADQDTITLPAYEPDSVEVPAGPESWELAPSPLGPQMAVTDPNIHPMDERGEGYGRRFAVLAGSFALVAAVAGGVWFATTQRDQGDNVATTLEATNAATTADGGSPSESAAGASDSGGGRSEVLPDADDEAPEPDAAVAVEVEVEVAATAAPTVSSTVPSATSAASTSTPRTSKPSTSNPTTVTTARASSTQASVSTTTRPSTTVRPATTSAPPTTAPQTTAAPKLGSISATIFYGPPDNVPAGNVLVDLNRDQDRNGIADGYIKSSRTNDKGVYRFEVEPGCYTLKFFAPLEYSVDASAQDRQVCVAASQNVPGITVVLRRLPVAAPSSCVVATAGVTIGEPGQNFAPNYQFYDRLGQLVAETDRLGGPSSTTAQSKTWSEAKIENVRKVVYVRAERSGVVSGLKLCQAS